MMDSKYWDYEFVFDSRYSIGTLFDVTEGQKFLISWDCPDGNQNGWVLNGNGCCSNITNLRNADVGRTGQTTREITASGTVRIGCYRTSTTYAVQYGTIRIKLI